MYEKSFRAERLYIKRLQGNYFSCQLFLEEIFQTIDLYQKIHIILTMTSDIRVQAAAKVNIGLRVLPRRADGFHNIESIFQTVDFYDELHVKPRSEQDVCIVHCEQFELPKENTLTSTYNAFVTLTGKHSGVELWLTKRIPAGGGLGGGSSDAASFLRALAALNDVPLTDELADAVAEKVGSDVFFFLHCGKNGKGAALVSGRGEVVRPVLPRKDFVFILAFPPVHSSTKEAYQLVDQDLEAGKGVSCPEFSELEAMYRTPVKNWAFANTFTQPLITKYPVIGLTLAELRKNGAVWSDMTGSGAVVFGVYDSSIQAEIAIARLRKAGINAVLAR